MNGVYAHPFVTKINYPGRFVKVLERVKSTYNRILFIVSINQDTTALQLFAGAIEWDWILYFGYVISSHLCLLTFFFCFHLPIHTHSF